MSNIKLNEKGKKILNQQIKPVSLSQVNEIVDSAKKEIHDNLSKMTLEIKQTEHALKKEMNISKDQFEQSIETDKISLITIFGIFASILSFLTIEFQFLKTLNDIKSIVGFTFILFALLLGLNLGLDFLVKNKEKNFIIYLIFVLCILIAGMIFICMGK